MYTITINGVPVQCETAAAAIELTRLAAANNEVSTGASVDRQAIETSTQSRWTEQRIRQFYGHIKPQQRKLIETLMNAPDGLTDAQLCQTLGLGDGRALGGVLTALLKNVKKVGGDPKDLYDKKSVVIGDGRQYEYTLSDQFRAATHRWKP